MGLLKNKLFISLILSLIVFLCLKLLLYSPPKNTEQIKSFWINKTHSKTKHNFVVGGDSRIYRGVSISKIEEKTNNKLTGVNLGFSSCGFSKEYVLFLTSRLSNALDKERYLILGITPVSLTEEFCKNESYNEYKNISYFEQLKIRYFRHILSFSSPYKPLEFIKAYKELKSNENYQEEYFDNGWVKSSFLIPDSTTANTSYIKTFTNHSVSEKITNDLFYLLDSIQKKGIKVIAFRPPTSIEIKNIEDSLSGYNEEYIKQRCKSKNIHWIELNSTNYTSYDGSHLDYISAEKLSEQIAIEINNISNDQ